MEIKESKQEEESLKIFRTLLDRSNDAIEVVDPETGRFIDCNEKAFMSLGYTREEFLSLTFFDIDPLMSESSRLSILETINTSGSVVFESLHRRKDGSTFPVEVNVTSVRIDRAYAVTTVRDISQRKKAGQQIDMLASSILTVSQCVSITDLEGNILFVNDAFLKTYGFDREELLGQPITIVYPANAQQQEHHRIHSDAFSTGWQGEVLNCRKNGDEFPVVLSRTAIKNELGECVALVGVATDISAQKRYENTLATFSLVGRKLNSANSYQQAAATIAEASDELFCWDACTIDLYSDETETITTVLNIDTIDGIRRNVPPTFNGMAPTPRMKRILNKGATLLSRLPGERFTDGGIPFGDVTRPSASLMFVPIRIGDRSLGILSVQSYKPRRYSESDLTSLQSLADYCAGALQRIRDMHALQVSEQKYRDLVELAPLGAYKSTLEGTIITANGALASILGYESPGDLQKHKMQEFYFEEGERERLIRLFDTGNNMRSLETQWKTTSGKQIWVELSSHAVRDSFDNIVYFEGFVQDITDRKHSQSQLQESEEMYRELVENINDIYFIANGNGNLLYGSPNLFSKTGYSKEELVGKSYIPLIAPEDRNRVLRHYREFSKSMEVDTRCEFRALHKNGVKVWVEQTTRACRHSDTGGIEYRNVVRNIDERKRYEQTLRLQSTALESAANGIVILDRNGLIQWVNSAFCELTGYQEDEVLGKNPRILKSGLQDDTFYRRLWETVLSGQVWKGEIINRKKDGTLYPEHMTVTPLLDEKGAISHFIAIKEDFSLRKEAEKKIGEAFAWQEAVFEGSRDAVFVTDARSVFISVNSAATALTGYSKEELLHMRIPDLHEDTDLEAYYKFHDRIMGGEQLLTEACVKRKDGTKIDAEFSNTRIVVGGIPYMHTAARDITERKRFEKQSFRSQRLESLGTLAGGIAHDLNNVLGPIMLTFDVLKKDQNDVRTRKLLDNAERSAQRGRDIISQILMFARGGEEKRGPVQIKHVLREIVEIARETFPRNIEIKDDIPSDLLSITANATHLHQVFMNLCVNARDAMPRGGVLCVEARNFTIDNQYSSLHSRVKAGPYISVSITDTGIGMSRDILDRVFDPFFTTKEPGKGTGLGLATVHTVVEKHGGFIDLQSKINKGTTFKIFLPAITGEVNQNLTQVETFLRRGKGETILVVDDEESVMEAIKHTLEDDGYQVLTACDGVDGVAVYSQNRQTIAAVLTDVMMPNMDGISMIKALKRLDPNIRILISSGMLPDTYGDSLRAIEVDEILSKPFTAQELLDAVCRVFEQSVGQALSESIPTRFHS